MARKKSPPKYSLHKATVQAVVYIDRKPVCLGKYESDESWEKYHRTITERWRPTGKPNPTPVQRSDQATITRLAVDYIKHATTYYQKHENRHRNWSIPIGPLQSCLEIAL